MWIMFLYRSETWLLKVHREEMKNLLCYRQCYRIIMKLSQVDKIAIKKFSEGIVDKYGVPRNYRKYTKRTSALVRRIIPGSATSSVIKAGWLPFWRNIQKNEIVEKAQIELRNLCQLKERLGCCLYAQLRDQPKVMTTVELMPPSFGGNNLKRMIM